MPQIDIAKILNPNSGELIIDADGVGRIQIVDNELDPIDCVLVGDGCIELDTKRYTCLNLTIDNLQDMILAIENCDEEADET